MSLLTATSYLTDDTYEHGAQLQPLVNRRLRDVKSTTKLRSRSSFSRLLNLVRDPVGTVGEAVVGWYGGPAEDERIAREFLEGRKHLLYIKVQEATSYNDWKTSVTELDELEGNNVWKAIRDAACYDQALVASRLCQLDDARLSCDIKRMLFIVRTSLTRDLGGMGNVELYRHSHVGTKDLIERYIDSALETLKALLELSKRLPEAELSHRQMLEQVLSARQAFGRSALLLSGGATFGMNHNGVLKTLWENKLLPRIISGASAGSIVSAILCTRTDEEIPALLDEFCHGDLAVFEEEGNEDSVLRKLTRFLTKGSLFDISHLTRVMRASLGDITFQEAYNRTRRILNICVSSASLYELPRLLNYVTAPNVLIWSAVAASCSVPFIFSPASLLAKDPRTGSTVAWNPSPQRWIDGSVDNDLPMTRLAEMFNVNHFIVSQVNPHVVPFLARDEGFLPAASDATLTSPPPPGIRPCPAWLHTLTRLAKGEALYRMRSLAEIGVLPNVLTKAASVLNQKYSGDITILPAIRYADFPHMLSNPSEAFMVAAALAGERATWPQLSRIRNHCAIELALDDAVQALRTRVVFSNSQVDLRLGAFGEARERARGKGRDGERAGAGAHSRRRLRKMSQTSEPDASLVRAVKESRHRRQAGQNQWPASEHSRSHSSLHAKARSLHLPSHGQESPLAMTFRPVRQRSNTAGTTSSTESIPQPFSAPRDDTPTSTRVSPPRKSPSYSSSSSISSSASRHGFGLEMLARDISSSGAETQTPDAPRIFTDDSDDNSGFDSEGELGLSSTTASPAPSSPAMERSGHALGCDESSGHGGEGEERRRN